MMSTETTQMGRKAPTFNPFPRSRTRWYLKREGARISLVLVQVVGPMRSRARPSASIMTLARWRSPKGNGAFGTRARGPTPRMAGELDLAPYRHAAGAARGALGPVQHRHVRRHHHQPIDRALKRRQRIIQGDRGQRPRETSR